MVIKKSLLCCWLLLSAQNTWANGTNIGYQAVLAGFLIVFTAGFCFSYVVNILLSYKKQTKSKQQILRSSLLTGFLTALFVLIMLYGTLL